MVRFIAWPITAYYLHPCDTFLILLVWAITLWIASQRCLYFILPYFIRCNSIFPRVAVCVLHCFTLLHILASGINVAYVIVCNQMDQSIVFRAAASSTELEIIISLSQLSVCLSVCLSVFPFVCLSNASVNTHV